ncbi:PriCT-2 domain-containing protein [Accumulibacter sp.]|nr:PriCT-2 domain-containing protein [Accumulibacter sp.]
MRYDFTETERAKGALWSLDPGADRETWVRVAMAAKAAGLDFNAFHEWSAEAGNYRNEADCRSVWQSIKRGGIGAATLFHEARAAGWTDDGETPTKRPQSRQERPQQPEAGKPPPHDPRALWDACEHATAAHPYIIKKLGLPDGMRVYHGPLTIASTACDGALVLPCRKLNGELSSVQFITQNGQKLFLPRCNLQHDGCVIIGGPLKPEDIAYIAEGIG